MDSTSTAVARRTGSCTAGCCRHGIRPTTAPSSMVISMPIDSARGTHAHRLELLGPCISARPHGRRVGSATGVRAPPRLDAMNDSGPPAASRRTLPGVQGLLRPACRELQHHDGPADQCGLRFTSMLINALRDERPTHVAVAFDVSRQTFRSEAFPEYKANRSKSPSEFAGQVDLIKTVLAAMDIVELSVDGYEADDIIATLTKQARAQGLDVFIVTGDRDAFQLVDERCTVLYPKRGVPGCRGWTRRQCRTGMV